RRPSAAAPTRCPAAGAGRRSGRAPRRRRAPAGLPTAPGSCVLPRERLDAVLVDIAAVAIVDDDRGKALDLEAADRLGPQIFVGDDRERLDELREPRPGPADRAEVDAPVLLERVL